MGVSGQAECLMDWANCPARSSCVTAVLKRPHPPDPEGAKDLGRGCPVGE